MTTPVERQIHALFGERIAAFEAADAKTFVSFYARDAVCFELPPPLREVGVDEYALQEWFAAFEGPVEREVRELVVTAGDDVAFAHSLTRMSGIRSGGEEVDLWYRETLGFQRVDGTWLITHEHASVPFAMDGTFRAAVDLQPE